METLQRTANRGSVSTGYDIDNSLKLERANSEQIVVTNSSQSGNRKTWTFSTWIKRTEISYNGAFGVNALFYAASSGMQINSSDKIVIALYASGLTGSFTTSQVFRDTSAWYHIVWTVDTTESTASNRVKLWINGQQVTDFDTETYPNLNDEFNFGEAQSAAPIRIGNAYWGTSPFSAYIAETHYLNGTAKQASDFGEYDADSGIWIPKEYTDGGYGDIGFYYKYDNASSMGEDSSGEGHDASSLTNITSADQATDTPTNNFATGNNRHVFSNPLTLVLTEGQTKIAKTANGWETLASTIAVTSGKWYMEMQNISVPESAMMSVFPTDIEFIGAGGQVNNYAGKVSGDGGISYYSYNGNVYQNAGNSSYGTAWANETNTMAIALDMDNGKVYFARANTWQNSGNPTSGATGTGAIDLIEPSKPHMMGYSIYANNTSGAVNFGGYTLSSISSAASDANGYGTFEYAPPSGYYALCTKNLAEHG